MQNTIIMDAGRISNAHWDQNEETLETFGIPDVSAEYITLQAIQQCDTFIVTHKDTFKIVKSRVDGMPQHAVLPLSYLDGVIDELKAWYQ